MQVPRGWSVDRHGGGGDPVRSAAFHSLLQRDDLPAAAREELHAISRESNSELFAESLFTWAEAQEETDREDLAAAAYAAVACLNVASEIFSRAQRRLAALQGQGSFGECAEGFLRRLGGNSEAPVMWAGMALGTGLFAGARATLLSRFLSRPASVLARGLTAEVLASAGAFTLETPAVWAATKGLNELIHPGLQAWDAGTNLRELTGLTLGLGPMKLISGRSSTFLRKPLPGVFRESMSLGGVVLGRRLNEWAWDLAPVSGARAVADGLAMLIDARIGAHLMRGALPGLYGFNRELSLRRWIYEKSFRSQDEGFQVALQAFLAPAGVASRGAVFQPRLDLMRMSRLGKIFDGILPRRGKVGLSFRERGPEVRPSDAHALAWDRSRGVLIEEFADWIDLEPRELRKVLVYLGQKWDQWDHRKAKRLRHTFDGLFEREILVNLLRDHPRALIGVSRVEPRLSVMAALVLRDEELFVVPRRNPFLQALRRALGSWDPFEPRTEELSPGEWLKELLLLKPTGATWSIFLYGPPEEGIRARGPFASGRLLEKISALKTEEKG